MGPTLMTSRLLSVSVSVPMFSVVVLVSVPKSSVVVLVSVSVPMFSVVVLVSVFVLPLLLFDDPSDISIGNHNPSWSSQQISSTPGRLFTV